MQTSISPRARRLWDRLRSWYGTRLTEQYGDEPPADWRRLVDHTDNDAVREALEVIRKRHATHPPTLPEFEAALRPRRRGLAAGEATTQDRLAAWVVKNRRLTDGQLAVAWTWQAEGDAATGHGFAITGVSIPGTPDGGLPFHVRAVDMLADTA